MYSEGVSSQFPFIVYAICTIVYITVLCANDADPVALLLQAPKAVGWRVPGNGLLSVPHLHGNSRDQRLHAKSEEEVRCLLRGEAVADCQVQNALQGVLRLDGFDKILDERFDYCGEKSLLGARNGHSDEVMRLPPPSLPSCKRSGSATTLHQNLQRRLLSAGP